MMYKKCYQINNTPFILNNLPNDIQYENYLILYKKNNQKIIKNFDNEIKKLKSKNFQNLLVYNSHGKLIDMDKSVYYNIQKNLK